MSIHRVAAEEVDGTVSQTRYYLHHPAVGILELGLSSYFQWRTLPLDFTELPGYATAAGLYAAWQLDDHRMTLRIERARKRNAAHNRNSPT